jgi:hypothetical protein
VVSQNFGGCIRRRWKDRAVQVQLQERASQSATGLGRQDRIRAALITEMAGWLGAVALLLAFGLVAAGLVQPSSGFYLGLNLFGALGLARASLSRRAYSPALLNIVWAVIAAFSLALLLLHA